MSCSPVPPRSSAAPVTPAGYGADIACALALCAMALTPLVYHWCAGETMAVNWDNYFHTLPLMAESWRQWSAGQVPVVTDGMYGGCPLLAQIHAQVLYWPNYIFFALGFGPVAAFDLTVAAHGVLFAAGMWFWMKDYGVSRTGRLAAILLVRGSGFYFSAENMWSQILASMGWVPWLALGLSRAMRAPSLWSTPMALTALAGAMLFFAGHPQFFLLAWLIVSVWCVTTEGKAPLFRRVSTLLLAGFLTTLLSAVQLFPTHAFLQDAFRQGPLTEDEVAFLSVEGAKSDWLLDALDTGGGYRPSAYHPDGMLHFNPIALGIPFVLLAIIGGTDIRKRHVLAGWMLVLIGFFTALHETQTVLAQVPAWNLFRNPIKNWLILLLGASWLAAHGVGRIAAAIDGWKATAFRMVLAGILIALFIPAMQHAGRPVMMERPVGTIDRWRYAVPRAPLDNNKLLSETARALVADFERNAPPLAAALILEETEDGGLISPFFCNLWLLASDRRCAMGMEPLRMNSMQRLAQRMAPDAPQTLWWDWAPGWQASAPRLGGIYDALAAVGRVTMHDRRVLFETLAPSPFLRFVPATDAGPALAEATVTISPHASVEHTVRAVVEAPGPGTLRAAIPYADGWVLSINGRPVPVRPGDDWTLEADCPAGRHEVTLVFRQPLLREGALISLLGLCACAAIFRHARREARGTRA